MSHAPFGVAGGRCSGSGKADRTVVDCAGDAPASCSEVPHCSGREPWRFGSGDRLQTRSESQDGTPLERALFAGRIGWYLGDSTRPWPQGDLWTRPHQVHHRCNPAIEAERQYSLELSADGSQSGRQQIDRQQSLEEPPHQAASDSHIQVVTRSEVPGKFTDVVGLSLNPPAKAMVLCVNEKSQIQALNRTQLSLPLKKGRCGTERWFAELTNKRIRRDSFFSRRSCFRYQRISGRLERQPQTICLDCHCGFHRRQTRSLPPNP